MKAVTEAREMSCIESVAASESSVKAQGFDCTLIYFPSSYLTPETVPAFQRWLSSVWNF